MLRFVGLVAAFLVFVALLLTRPWSSQNSWRQMRIFHPAERVHNFRAFDELFPSRIVHRSATPHHFESRPAALPSSYSYQGRTLPLDAFLTRTETTGFLVLKGNAIVSERYFQGATADSPFTSWSVAKSVLSLLVGIARDEGRLKSVDSTLAKYAPELAGSAYGAVPLRHALAMASGIAFGEVYGDPLSDIHLYFARIFYFRESSAHYLSSRSAKAEPGALFEYKSMDTLAAGLALRGVLQKPLTRYLEEKIWKPIGMEYDASWSVEDQEGAELAFCCLNVRLRDYAKIGRLLARGGDWDGKRIVSEQWLRESTAPAPLTPRGRPDGSWGYGFQWWLPGTDGAVMAAGVWSQFIYIDRARDVVIVKTSVNPRFEEDGGEHVAVFEAVASGVAGE